MKNIAIALFIITSISFAMNAQENGITSAAVDTQPVFAKGKMTMDQFFKIYLKYPEKAIEEGKEGIVLISFDVEADGEVTNPEILKGTDQSLDEEALRVVALFPYYQPATKNGNNVKTSLTVPVKFKLTDTPDQNTSLAPKASSEKFPLYVVDDKIVNDDINVNANEIESIRVIKGKKAIAKYGERAGDGVIVITTKRITPGQ